MNVDATRPSGPVLTLSGPPALAAAAPALFGVLAAAALAWQGAALWAVALAALGAAPLAAVGAQALARPVSGDRFAQAALALGATAGAIAWMTGGAGSPATPWAFAAFGLAALLGAPIWAAAAGGLAVAFGAATAFGVEPPARLLGFITRSDREMMLGVSWIGAIGAFAAAAAAARRSLALALPAIRRPEIQTRVALERLSEDAAICALRIDGSGRIAGAIGGVRETTGFAPETLAAEPLSALLHVDDAAALAGETARIAARDPAAGASAPLHSLRLRTSSGGFRWLDGALARAELFPAPAGADAGAFVLVLRARWRQELDAEADADPDRAVFLAHMNQEMRGALKSIVGYTDILKNELLGPLGSERYRDYARMAHEGGEKMLELVDELLDLTALEAGRFEMSPELVDPVPLIDGAARAGEARVAAAGMALETRIAPNAPHLRTDRRALRRVLAAMLLDAVRRGRMGDALILSLSGEDDGLRVAVERRAAAEGAEASADPSAPAAADAAAFSQSKIGRAVSRLLAERLGGALIFHDAGAAAEGDGLASELLLPMEAPAREPAPELSPAAPGLAPPAPPPAPTAAPEPAPPAAAKIALAPPAPSAAAAEAPPDADDVDRPLFEPAPRARGA